MWHRCPAVYRSAIVQLENVTMCPPSLFKCKFFCNSWPSFVTRWSLLSLSDPLAYYISYNLQLFLLVIVNSHGYPVVAIYDCVNLLFIFQQNKSNSNQLTWPSPVVFADIYRSVSVLSFNREFFQTLAADHSAQMVCVIVWRCEVTHRAAETLRRRSSPVHPEMTHVLPGATASLSPKTRPPPPTPSYPHSSPSLS